MLHEAKKLRWMGIDMCSRTRRRVLVVATYAAYLVAVFVHPPQTYQFEMILWYATLLSPMWTLEDISPWVRRAAMSAMAIWAFAILWMPARPNGHLDGPFYATLLLTAMTGLSYGRLVASAYAGWMANAMRHASRLGWRGQRRLARKGFLYGLDGFAYNEYGVRFRELSPEQQAIVAEMRQANPQGKWMLGMERKLVDDERLRMEDNELRARVQRTMTFVLLGSAVFWSWAASSGWIARGPLPAHVVELGRPLHAPWLGGEAVSAWAWAVFALGVTLRQAIVLWTEDDPRGVNEELQVIQEQEA